MVRSGGRERATTAVVVLALLCPLALPDFYLYTAADLIIWALLAISLDVLLGYAGLPSFGQAAFFGVPAYTIGIVVSRGGPLTLAILAAIAALLVIAMAVGYFATKTGGVGYIVVTMLASFSLFQLALVWTGLTGGENGLYLPRASSLAVLRVRAQYLVVAGLGSAVLWASRRLARSGYGLALAAVKSNERRCRALGYNVERIKLQVTLVSAGIAGIAGILYALVERALAPDLLGPGLSTEVVIWVLLGGAQTLVGPIMGAALFVTLKQVLNTFESYPLVLGLLFVAVVTWAPAGLIALRPPGRRRRRSPGGPRPSPPETGLG
ncbi:MAG: branched-chain amino acid ABC transporter permease [Deltaproteobacteria bacterium]|jgi:branched-chain amino acid transport system permease protein|nr:branched-chain amino acid ABC transporter permease [Deltaproteobacteria bacterium]